MDFDLAAEISEFFNSKTAVQHIMSIISQLWILNLKIMDNFKTQQFPTNRQKNVKNLIKLNGAILSLFITVM
jgi:hypothetical protein